MITADVFMVNHFMLANRDSGHGLIAGLEIRPTYYTFQMYQHFGDQQVYAISGEEYVTVYAAQDADGNLTIMVINLADTDTRVTLQVQDEKLATAEVWRLDADHNAENLGLLDISSGELVLPGQSTTLYRIEQ
jgi:hypothetical protein